MQAPIRGLTVILPVIGMRSDVRHIHDNRPQKKQGCLTELELTESGRVAIAVKLLGVVEDVVSPDK